MATPAKTIDEKLIEGLGSDRSEAVRRAFHAFADRIVQAAHLDEDASPNLTVRTHRRAITSANLDRDEEFVQR